MSQIRKFKHDEMVEQSVLSIKHDLNNHIGTISNLIKSGKTEDALHYLDRISSHMTMNEHGIETGNVDLNSILSFKLNKIKENNIKLKYHIAVPQHLNIETYDLTIIIGNLLDNAIRAVKNLEHQKRQIKLDIHYDKGILLINIINGYNETLQYSNLLNKKNKKVFLSTKKDKEHHGIGLRNVEKAVERYNGSIDFDIVEDKKIFRVFVLLYMKKRSAIKK